MFISTLVQSTWLRLSVHPSNALHRYATSSDKPILLWTDLRSVSLPFLVSNRISLYKSFKQALLSLKGMYNISNVGKTASMSMLTLFESRYTLKGRYTTLVTGLALTFFLD